MAVLALKQWFSLKFKQCASIISSKSFWKIYLHRWINLEFPWSSLKVGRTSTRVILRGVLLSGKHGIMDDVMDSFCLLLTQKWCFNGFSSCVRVWGLPNLDRVWLVVLYWRFRKLFPERRWLRLRVRSTLHGCSSQKFPLLHQQFPFRGRKSNSKG